MNLIDFFAGVMADYRTAQGVEDERGETGGARPEGDRAEPDMEAAGKDVTGPC